VGSASIAFYRSQAGAIDGVSDDKIGASRYEVVAFQLVASAGDN